MREAVIYAQKFARALTAPSFTLTMLFATDRLRLGRLVFRGRIFLHESDPRWAAKTEGLSWRFDVKRIVAPPRPFPQMSTPTILIQNSCVSLFWFRGWVNPSARKFQLAAIYPRCIRTKGERERVFLFSLPVRKFICSGQSAEFASTLKLAVCGAKIPRRKQQKITMMVLVKAFICNVPLGWRYFSAKTECRFASNVEDMKIKFDCLHLKSH